MRVLMSGLMVIAAGAATVLLATAALAGLKAMGYQITGNVEMLVPLVSVAVVIVSYRSVFGIRRKPLLQSALRWYEVLIFVVLTLSGVLALIAFLGPEPYWWGIVSLCGFFAAISAAEDRWKFLREGRSRRD